MLSNSPVISPIEEIVAYETLWKNQKASFKSIAEILGVIQEVNPRTL